MVKLKSIMFGESSFRKLGNLNIEFSDRLTLIAGHNGVGKSTILGLIASASGDTNRKQLSYFNKPFSVDINDIIHLDPKEHSSKSLKAPWPQARYVLGDESHVKNLTITVRGEEERLRSVPRTDSSSENTSLSKQDGKVPLPTIYLGMVRMLPIGECEEKDVQSNLDEIHDDDAKFLTDFVKKVIASNSQTSDIEITDQIVANTKKRSKHPTYPHSSKSISLGQDSLSSIATALASFNRLKREGGDSYQGGLLVVDEIDAGFHPKAQKNLIDALRSAARKLSLQIVATTHSPLLIEYAHAESYSAASNQNDFDSVVYLAGTISPKSVNWSLDQILSDMSLTSLPVGDTAPCPDIKAYLEDSEAAEFLKGILGMKTNYKKFYGNNAQKRLQIVPIGVGGSNIVKLPSYDDYFKKVLLIVDADTEVPQGVLNALKLPCQKNTRFNPEKSLYTYIQELCKGDISKYSKTQSLLLSKGISDSRLQEDFLSSDVSIDKRESSKKWFKSVSLKIHQYELLSYWASDHSNEVSAFKVQLETKLHDLFLKLS